MTRPGPKRGLSEFNHNSHKTPPSNGFGVGATLSVLNGTNTTSRDNDNDNHDDDNHDDDDGGNLSRDANDEWQIVEKGKKTKRRRLSQGDLRGSPQPSIFYSPNARLERLVGLGDLQQLVLYVLADVPAPKWVAVNRHHDIQRVVVLMVPGLEEGMFNGSISLGVPNPDAINEEEDLEKMVKDKDEGHGSRHNVSPSSPDAYYPRKLSKEELPEPLHPLADAFQHVWPIKLQGDSRIARLYSPIGGMLQVPLQKKGAGKTRKGPKGPQPKEWQDKKTPVTHYITGLQDLRDNKYTIHPALLESEAEKAAEMRRRTIDKHNPDNGWIDLDMTVPGKTSDSNGSPSIPSNNNDTLTAGKDVFAVDCEMCLVAAGKNVLTRVSIVSWDGEVIMDELVKPDEPIVNYQTQYSGITKELLEPVTTTLSDIHAGLREILTSNSVLIGHSLNSDLDALKITHPYTIDTVLLYPHPSGPPYKSALKYLTQKYLSRAIQTGPNGHDAVEDAKAALDLVKQKCEKGPAWGTYDANTESIFNRIGRYKRNPSNNDVYQTSAVVDWGFPKKGHGAHATLCINCENDSEVVDGIARAANGDEDGQSVPNGGVDFVWGRFRELEAIRGWWNRSRITDNNASRENVNGRPDEDTSGTNTTNEPSSEDLAVAVANTTTRIKQVYDALPSETAFIVYTGISDPLELARWQKMYQQYKREFSMKKWDELSVKWTDVEENAQKQAAEKARQGLGFMTVKTKAPCATNMG